MDLSRELRRVLGELRDKQLLEAFLKGKEGISTEQMGHSSIQVTVDTHGHLIPGANVAFVDRLDDVPFDQKKTTPQQSATNPQQSQGSDSGIPTEVVDLI